MHCISERRAVAKARHWTSLGTRASGGIRTAGGAGGAVTTSLMAVMLPLSAPGRGWYDRVPQTFGGTVLCSTKPDKGVVLTKGGAGLDISADANRWRRGARRPTGRTGAVSAQAARRPRHLDRRARLPRQHG